jgi:hypothetical protein
MKYTPETILGATLPCGAKVVEAQYASSPANEIIVDFDRPPEQGDDKGHSYYFSVYGKHVYNYLPDLIPPELAMTLRDQFAMAALAGICTNRENAPYLISNAASVAYRIADAMMAERAKAR